MSDTENSQKHMDTDMSPLATNPGKLPVYPTPGQNPQSEKPKSFPIERYKIPWVKIAVLGLLLEIAAVVIFAISLMTLFAVALSVIMFSGGLVGIFVCIGAALGFTSWHFLKLWGVIRAGAISWLAVAFGGAIGLLITKGFGVASFGIAGNSLLVGLILALGPGLFLLMTFITNVLPKGPQLIGVLSVTAIGLNIYAIAYTAPPKKLTHVSEISWAISPGYLPQGVAERSDNSCANTVISGDYYKCMYYFIAPPGYLAPETQAKIDKAISIDSRDSLNRPPDPFIIVTVAKNGPILDPFKFKDGICDIGNMRERIGQGSKPPKEFANLYQPRDRKCASTTTPGGKTVYYDAPENETERYAQVPSSFYFEQNGVVIMIDGPGPELLAFSRALYITDPNFLPEMYKFIDSYK